MPVVSCEDYSVFINESYDHLKSLLSNKRYSKYGILVDENTSAFCLPILEKELSEFDLKVITINSGEKNKNIETCQNIWSAMLEYGFDRHSILINLGGGVIGDMGGFCASTFMRGMDFIQVPTTLLSQVDASVGGKLGIDFQDYKNIIGLILDPAAVWIDTRFLKTLDPREVRSGFAEIIKHALIRDADKWEEIKKISDLQNVDWESIIHHSVKIKRDVVVEDKYEGGLRKILNFGHTLGHAIESENLHQEDYLLHGEAISIGMITEAYLSMKVSSLSESDYEEIVKYILTIYPHYKNHLKNAERILEKMIKDKKNRQGKLNFSLLTRIGDCTFDVSPDSDLLEAALSTYQNL